MPPERRASGKKLARLAGQQDDDAIGIGFDHAGSNLSAPMGRIKPKRGCLFLFA
jgi:hypothetical protein